MISLVAARSKNGVIGKDGGLPWHIPEELAFFKRETIGSAMIMGRKTWDSLPKKPLPGRLNIVLSRSKDFQAPGDVKVCGSMDQAVREATSLGYSRISAIGGEQVFKDFIGIADRLVITEVDVEVTDGDAFFPDINDEEWSPATSGLITQNPISCTWTEYLRTII
jgi:dihydrofolate reductase